MEATSKNFEEFSDDIKRHPWKLLFKGKEKGKEKWKNSGYFLRVFGVTGTMNEINLLDFDRGWILGNFDPSIMGRSDIEIWVLHHYKDQKWDFHYHQNIIEINILIDDKMLINNIEINQYDIFIFEKNIISYPIFLGNCHIIYIKIPPIIGDKHII